MNQVSQLEPSAASEKNNSKPRHICYACGSTTTYKDTEGNELWNANRDNENNYLCGYCNRKLILEPNQSTEFKDKRKAKYRANWETVRPRRINFKDKRRIVDSPIRSGVCSNCKRTVASGEIKQTQMHHRLYDIENPLAHTVELCVRCHTQHHWGKIDL